MEVTKIGEAGYDAAKYGMSLSFKDRAVPPWKWWTLERKARYDKVLKANATRNGGHNKFLEHIMVWLDVEAPRYWWSEFDTYRVGVSKQSESTMHTLQKRDLTDDDFAFPVPLSLINEMRQDEADIQWLKSRLPEGYLQRREVVLSYKVLAHIIVQRHNHRLPEWRYFVEEICKFVEHPELLPDLDKLRS